MVQLPTPVNATKTLLDRLEFPQRRGNTIAMSTIGDECARKLWFNLHWVGEPEKITVRVRNLFNTGTRAEDFIIKDLERIGILVKNRQEELWGFMDHAHGFTDGACENVPDAPKTTHLLEIKTHNDRNFTKLVKEGVRKCFPNHYAQCQRYMKGTGLKRCLYVGYNKNTSEYYIERIRYDAGFADDLVRKEQDIIMSSTPPKKIFERSWYGCKFCQYSENCHDLKSAAKNCRTCEHSDLAPEGKWVCAHPSMNNPIDIPIEIQKVGCDSYMPIGIE